MRDEDSSSDDVPYLPTEEYQNYENQQRLCRPPNPQNTNRHGRSHFTEDELRELDATIEGSNAPVGPEVSSTATPVSESDYVHHSVPVYTSAEVNTQLPVSSRQSQFGPQGQCEDSIQEGRPTISWGRRALGLLLIIIPAVMIGVAAHFLDTSMSDFELAGASFLVFQGVLWPCLGILLMDLCCTPKKHVVKNSASLRAQKTSQPESTKDKIQSKSMIAACIFIQSNLSAATMILQILSIQRLNISISLALTFGFDVIVILIQYVLKSKSCSLELIILSIVSYCGYGVAAIPAFVSSDETTRTDTAVGVGASVGVMLLSIPSSFLLAYLRRNKVRESVLGSSFAFFGCIQALLVKEIQRTAFDLRLDGHSFGWVAGLISVVFLGTIFLHLESRLSGLIWERDDDKNSSDFSSITRTRIAVFILSCSWELLRLAFRRTTPIAYDIIGGCLVMLSFLLAGGYQAWYKSNQIRSNTTNQENAGSMKQGFCAFIPWLFSQRPSRIYSVNE